MSESTYLNKYSLLCLRLAAECRGIAAGAQEPELRAHFLHVAGMWDELAHHRLTLH